MAACCSKRHRHWQRVGSSAAASRNRSRGGSGAPSPPFPFLAGGEGHRHLQQEKKTHKQLMLGCYFFIFQICFFLWGFVVFLSASGAARLKRGKQPCVGCCWVVFTPVGGSGGWLLLLMFGCRGKGWSMWGEGDVATRLVGQR